MRACPGHAGCTMPLFMEETRIIEAALSQMTFAELQALWKCSDAVAKANAPLCHHREDTARGAAILSYDGMQFRRMGVSGMDAESRAYLSAHARILSGLYGLLRPFDGIAPYRLDMENRLSAGGYKNLYAFWGRKLYDAAWDEDRTILNLASAEYSRCIQPYLSPGDRFIQVDFMTRKEGKLRQQSTYAKMGRGEMVRFLAENQIRRPEGARDFQAIGFSFDPSLSGADHFVFCREG